MGRVRVKLASMRTNARYTPGIRVPSPSFLSRGNSPDAVEYKNQSEVLISSNGGAGEFNSIDHDRPKDSSSTEGGNKIMVVIDSSSEAKGAIEWALANTVQKQDTVVLVQVVKPSRPDSKNGKHNLKAYELFHTMKNMCVTKRPGVEVRLVVLEGKEKGAVVVEETKRQRVSLLVIGRRKRSRFWSLMKRWAGRRQPTGVVDYCIQNASCMAIAVRRKNRKLGGYLITTKRHRNFWLLA